MEHRTHKRNQATVLALGIFIGIGIGFLTAAFTPFSKQTSAASKYDTVHLAVNSVRIDAHGGGPLTPRAGMVYVIADITLKNRTTYPTPIAPLLDMYVKDAEGRVYSSVAVPSALEMKSGNLSAGDALREEVGFEVPANAQGLHLYYEPEVSGAGIQISDLASFLK